MKKKLCRLNYGLAVCTVFASISLNAVAQPKAALPAHAASSVAPAQQPSVTPHDAPRSSTPEPVIIETILDDRGARIEEVRVRGEVKSIKVQPKGAPEGQQFPAYQVLPLNGGRDPSLVGNAGKGAAGQRVWNIFNF